MDFMAGRLASRPTSQLKPNLFSAAAHCNTPRQISMIIPRVSARRRARAISIDVNGQSVTFGTALTSSGGSLTNLDSAGGGRLTLTQPSTYTGGTIVNGGTLLVNNASGSGTGSGSVTVNSGATLGGSGAIAGAVTFSLAAPLLPGRVSARRERC